MSADKLLDYPADKLSPQLQTVQRKMNEALAHSHSAKQLFLFLGFKQGEIDEATGYPRAKRGRMKGSSGLTKEQRARAAMTAEEARLEELAEAVKESNDWELEIADAKGLGMLDTELLRKFVKAREISLGFARRVIDSRKGGAQ